MSKLKQDLEQSQVAESLPVSGLAPLVSGFPGTALAVEESGAGSCEIGPARVFRDKVYTSRMLIMPGGQALPVEKGLVIACGDDQYEYLSGHPELEPATE